jgi:hypothetical protein
MFSIDTLFTILFCGVIVYGAVLHHRHWADDNRRVPLKLRHKKSISVGLSAASVITWFILADIYIYYCRTRSNIVKPELGRIYGLTNHGQVAYVTLAERNEIILLAVLCGVFFLTAYVLDRSVTNTIVNAGREDSFGE